MERGQIEEEVTYHIFPFYILKEFSRKLNIQERLDAAC